VGGNSSPQSGSVYSIDGGKTWNNSITDPALSIDITCRSTVCVTAGETVSVSTDAGVHWTQKTFSGTGSGGYLTVSCTTDASKCLAVGPNPAGLGNPTVAGELGRSTDGASTWTRSDTTLPASSATFQNVSCWSTTACMAIGPDPNTTGQIVSIIGSVTTNGGATWGSLFAPGINALALKFHPSDPEFGFSCSTSGACIVVASNSTGAAAYTTSNNGASWTASSVS
jgi:hypothetical protein